MSKAATQVRYHEFIRRTGKTESSDSVREFLHIEILRILSSRNPHDLVLHGGCKTRYIDGSPRYSMDMDFSMRAMIDGSRSDRETLVHQAIDPVMRELEHVGITLDTFRERWHRDDTGVKLCFKANRLKDLFPAIFAGQAGDINFNIDLDILLPGERIRSAAVIADRSLRILVLDDATHMARKISAVLLRNQLRDLYDLDLYITRGTQYDLPVARLRLQLPDLSHDDIINRLCQRIEEWDITARAHQLHLPSEAELAAFLITTDRIATIRKMRPLIEED